jgi:putative zinc finger/helix-turn-helix YgiT family protein
MVEDVHYECAACGTRFYAPGQLQATQEKAARQVRETHGLISPERIRMIRESNGLTQDQFERLIRVPPKTIARWEGGAVLPSRAANTLLVLLEAAPEVIPALAAQSGVSLARRAAMPWIPESIAVRPQRANPIISYPEDVGAHEGEAVA